MTTDGTTGSGRANIDDDRDRDIDEPDIDDRESGGARPARRRSPIAVTVIAVLVVLVVAAVSFSVGRLSTLGEATPTDTSAEAGFSRDMQTHHNQGVELAFIIRDRTDSDDVRTLAYDIATTQGSQSGMMYGWLQVWGLSQAGSEPSMTWMTRPALDGATGHDHTADPAAHEPGAPMPGLATDEQITTLKSLSGEDAEIYFLQLMIAHHKGAIEMADAVLARSTNSIITTFANGIVSSQQSEIDLMESMLADRGATDEIPS